MSDWSEIPQPVPTPVPESDGASSNWVVKLIEGSTMTEAEYEQYLSAKAHADAAAAAAAAAAQTLTNVQSFQGAIDDGLEAIDTAVGSLEGVAADVEAARVLTLGYRDTAAGHVTTAAGHVTTAQGARDAAIAARDTTIGYRDTTLGYLNSVTTLHGEVEDMVAAVDMTNYYDKGEIDAGFTTIASTQSLITAIETGYYNRTDTDTLLAGKAATAHNHDDRYYTETEMDATFAQFPTTTQMNTALATRQPLDATLTALAGVATAADRVPYFTGTDAVSLATFTTFGRSLVDDADASAGRSTLGLGALATLGTVGTTQITDDAVTNAKLANMAASTFKGRVTASTGDPEDMTVAQARTMLGQKRVHIASGSVTNVASHEIVLPTGYKKFYLVIHRMRGDTAGYYPNLQFKSAGAYMTSTGAYAWSGMWTSNATTSAVGVWQSNSVGSTAIVVSPLGNELAQSFYNAFTEIEIAPGDATAGRQSMPQIIARGHQVYSSGSLQFYTAGYAGSANRAEALRLQYGAGNISFLDYDFYGEL